MRPESWINDEVHILIVEDSPTQAKLLNSLLTNQGYRVTAAENGVQALEQLKGEKPTLIISDIVMPEMNGYELCRRIKADERLSDIPVILLTSLSDPSDIIMGLEVRADNFITKPYDEKFLCSRIQHILINLEIRKRHTATGVGVELFFAGKRHYLTSERIQMLDLLISSYESAVQKYRELEKANLELEQTNLELSKAHRQLGAQAEELRALALIDELTGLHNRRSFFGLAEQQKKISDRSKREMLLFYIDLDDLKSINDGMGHQEGDRALVDTARILRDTFRYSDIVARLGGDEFAALVIDVSPESSRHFTGRLKENLKALNVGREPQISVSIGIAAYDPEYPTPFDDLLARADKLMYDHKKNGRKKRGLR